MRAAAEYGRRCEIVRDAFRGELEFFGYSPEDLRKIADEAIDQAEKAGDVTL